MSSAASEAAIGDGTFLGRLIASHPAIRSLLPTPRVSVQVDLRGGYFCDVVVAPPPGAAASAAGTPLARWTLDIVQWGRRQCAWK